MKKEEEQKVQKNQSGLTNINDKPENTSNFILDKPQSRNRSSTPSKKTGL